MMQPLLLDLSLLMPLFCTNNVLPPPHAAHLLKTESQVKNPKCKVCFSGFFIKLNADEESRWCCRYRKERKTGVAALRWTIKATLCKVGKLKVILNQNNWLTACGWQSVLKDGLTRRSGIFGFVKMLKIENTGKLVLKVWQSTMFQNIATNFICWSGSSFILILLRCC